MKKNYTLISILLLLFFSGGVLAQEPQKKFINYQGVARNAGNELMASEAMNLGLAIRFGAASASIAYEETHSLTTDANGVFSLKIGNGNVVSGDYGNLAWGSGAAYVTVSINGSEIGTTELLAVPYAITSGDGDNQSAAEVVYDNSVSNLTATNTQEAIDELVGSGIVDADADPTNELQTISFDSNTNELSLTDGGTVSIPNGGTDADADPTNEFQNLSFDTNTNELSLSDGNSITIPSGGTDADADPTNELQDISLSGTNLSISDGSTIDLAPIVPPGGTDDQNLELTGDVLGIENGNGSVDLSTYRDDNDADPANEFQTLNFDTNTSELSLSDGNTVILPNGGGGGASSIDELSDGKSDSSSVFLGENAGASDDGDNKNVGVGQDALYNNTTGRENTANGFGALYSNTQGNSNTANGVRALYINTIGLNNTANGANALYSNTEGNNNTANGSHALIQNTTGNRNTANGTTALASNTTGSDNTAIGYGALIVNKGVSGNTAIGAESLFSNTTGFNNTANGYQALRSNLSGRLNTANGSAALRSNNSGIYNTAIGSAALLDNTSGNRNTAVGEFTLAKVTTGNNNIGLGAGAQVPNATGSNQVRIGNHQITYAGIQVPWTTTSDARWKEKIQDLPYGLNMISQLRPVDYLRKNNAHQTREIGFIAQEVEEVLAQLGYNDQGMLNKDDKGYMSLRYNDFIPVLTKAVQELHQKTTRLEQTIELLVKTNESLLKHLEKFEAKNF